MRATLKYPESMQFLDRGFARRKCGVECISELCRTLCGLKPGPRTWLALLVFVFSFNIRAAEEHDFVAEAEAAYRAAQAAYSTNQTNEAAIAVARTAFDYADLAPNDNIRENIANIG